MARFANTDWRGAGVVLGCTLGNLVTSKTIVNATFGVFLKPVTASLGWHRADFSMLLLIMSLVGVIGYPLAGRAADRFGFRRVFALGMVLFALSMASMYFASTQKLLAYAQFVLIGIAATLSSTVLLGKPIAIRFDRKPGFIFALTECGMNLGFAVMPPVAALLLTIHGWRFAYLGLAAIVLTAGLPTLLLIGDPKPNPVRLKPEASTDGLSAADARGTGVFWLLLASVGLAAGATSATTSHMIPILTDHGLPLSVATTVFTGWAIASAGSQVGAAAILDWTQAPRWAAPFLLAGMIGLALFQMGKTPALAVLAGACIGLANGVIFGLLPFTVRRYFGPKAFSEIYGSIFGVSVLAAGIAPVLMDFVFDRTGQYALALLYLACAIALSTGLILFLPSSRTMQTRHRRPAIADAGVAAVGDEPA
jgi:MFS family permease